MTNIAVTLNQQVPPSRTKLTVTKAWSQFPALTLSSDTRGEMVDGKTDSRVEEQERRDRDLRDMLEFQSAVGLENLLSHLPYRYGLAHFECTRGESIATTQRLAGSETRAPGRTRDRWEEIETVPAYLRH
ncbi:hypothetical protein Bbelb_437780 [Branchiostoma belcheri]|nr:hypothetical protein Bbelb_437780 [Branchiostoma belcheri]